MPTNTHASTKRNVRGHAEFDAPPPIGTTAQVRAGFAAYEARRGIKRIPYGRTLSHSTPPTKGNS